MTKKIIYIIPVLFFIYFVHESFWKIGYGYDIKLGRYDDWKIERHGKVIVGPTIHDFKVFDEYVVGVFSPVKDMKCGKFTLAITESINGYFVLHIDSGKVRNYYNKSEFISELSEIGIELTLLDLHFELLDKVWDAESKYYGGFFTINDYAKHMNSAAFIKS